MKWESFDPIACDTCSATSMVHNTLLKILNRPGLNFETAFNDAATRALRRQMASDGRDIDEATDDERADVYENLELTEKQFGRCMRDLASYSTAKRCAFCLRCSTQMATGFFPELNFCSLRAVRGPRAGRSSVLAPAASIAYGSNAADHRYE